MKAVAAESSQELMQRVIYRQLCVLDSPQFVIPCSAQLTQLHHALVKRDYAFLVQSPLRDLKPLHVLEGAHELQLVEGVRAWVSLAQR